MISCLITMITPDVHFVNLFYYECVIMRVVRYKCVCIHLLDTIYNYAVIGLMPTKEGVLVIHISSIVILATGNNWCHIFSF